MDWKQRIANIIGLIGSRKIAVAIATIVVAFAAKKGWNLDTEFIAGIVATGMSVILGIAIEDHGEKLAKTAREKA